MKKWLLISSIALSSFTVGAIESSSDQNRVWVSGSQWIQELYEHYQEGAYNKILEEIDKEYQEGMAEGRYDLFLNQWEEAIKEYKDVSDEGLQYRKKMEKMEEEIAKLDKKINKRLSAIAKSHPDLPVTKIIQAESNRPAKSNVDSDDFIWFNDELLAVRIRGVINEYALKYSILHVMLMDKDDVSPDQLKNYIAILNIEKTQKLKDILEKFPDHEMRSPLSDSFDLDLTKAGKSHDKEYLVALGTKEKLPENRAEEKVAAVMADYLKKRDVVIKKYFEKP